MSQSAPIILHTSNTQYAVGTAIAEYVYFTYHNADLVGEKREAPCQEKQS